MFLSFPPPTKMFQFRGLAHFRVTGLLPAGLSHSDISGSILVCKSPELFAAYHVLRRLQEPRHPPYALHYFLPSRKPYCVLGRPYLITSIMSKNFGTRVPHEQHSVRTYAYSGAVVVCL